MNLLGDRIKSSISHLGVLKTLASDADAFLTANENGAKIISSFNGTDEEDNYASLKNMIYTSYKAFPEVEEYNTFIGNFQSALNLSFEIIIIDPIKFYLKLTDTDFIAIFDSVTIQAPFTKADNSEAVSLCLEAQAKLKESYTTDSGFVKQLTSFLKDVVYEYNSSFKKYHDTIRLNMGTKEERQKFMSSFENGVLFVEKNKV
jgi:hypothetical protein